RSCQLALPGLEPGRLLRPADFESASSTNFDRGPCDAANSVYHGRAVIHRRERPVPHPRTRFFLGGGSDHRTSTGSPTLAPSARPAPPWCTARSTHAILHTRLRPSQPAT